MDSSREKLWVSQALLFDASKSHIRKWNEELSSLTLTPLSNKVMNVLNINIREDSQTCSSGFKRPSGPLRTVNSDSLTPTSPRLQSPGNPSGSEMSCLQRQACVSFLVPPLLSFPPDQVALVSLHWIWIIKWSDLSVPCCMACCPQSHPAEQTGRQ